MTWKNKKNDVHVPNVSAVVLPLYEETRFSFITHTLYNHTLLGASTLLL